MKSRMYCCRPLFFIIALLLAVLSVHAQNTPKRTLLALSKKDHTLSLVDPATLKVITRIPVGVDPHEVIASPDGKTAYVTIFGGGSLHELNVIDLVAQQPLKNIDTRPLYGPHGVAFVNGKVWFTAEGSKAVARYDPATGKMDWSMGTGQDGTHMLYVTNDGNTVYTTNMGSGTVSILTQKAQPAPTQTSAEPKHTEWQQTVVPATRGSEGFDVLPDGSQLWTASGADGVISIIDLANKKPKDPIDAKVMGANRLMFTPDGKRAFVSSLRTGELTVLDVASRKAIKRIPLCDGAAGILMDKENNRVFVACSANDYVAVIDLASLQVTHKLDVGGTPDGLAWAIQP